MTVFDRVNDYHEKQGLRGQITSLQTRLGAVPDHYLALNITRDEQDKLIANLKILNLDPVKEAPAIYSECGTEETRVASELTEAFREDHLPAFYSPSGCGPDPFHKKKGIVAYILVGTEDTAPVKRLLGSLVGTGIDVTVKPGSAAQVGQLLTPFPVAFYVDGD